MSPPTLISVINQSLRLTDAEVEQMVHAVGLQLAEHAAPLLGLVPAIEFVPRGRTPTAGGAPFTISDVPDQPGVEGYHWSDAAGAQGKIFTNPSLDNGGSALAGMNSVSSVLSHEALETAFNFAANRWADGPKGLDFALEVGDPVQPSKESELYAIEGVTVANFVLPAYFDPDASPGTRLDYLRVLKSPFTMTRGGYQITRTEPGHVADVFGEGVYYAEAAPGIHVHFGPDFPLDRRAGKIWSAGRRRPRPTSS